MASTEYQTLLEKIDRLSEKIDSQFVRIEDVKLSKSEYEKAHETLVLRVQAIEQSIQTGWKAAEAVHEKLETASQVRYDKTDAKIEALNVKIDALKDTMNTRFDNLRDTNAANRRSWGQILTMIIVSTLGASGIGSIIYYFLHLAHP